MFRVPRARLIARWPRFIGRGECTTETVFRRWFFAAVIARYRLLIARTFQLTRDGRSLEQFGERPRSMKTPTNAVAHAVATNKVQVFRSSDNQQVARRSLRLITADRSNDPSRQKWLR